MTSSVSVCATVIALPLAIYGIWRKLRDKAELPGLRFHDLQHTIITGFVEMGAPDHAMESISGHLSRRMSGLCSHIRLDARHSGAVHGQPAKAANQ